MAQCINLFVENSHKQQNPLRAEISKTANNNAQESAVLMDI